MTGTHRDVIRVGVAQWSPVLGSVGPNLEQLATVCEQAREEGADLLVTPELGLTGYLLKDLVPDLAMAADHPVLAEVASLSRGIPLVAGFVERTPDGSYCNAAGYWSGGELVHLHRKVYLPTYGLFDEGRFFARGDRIRSFPTPWGPLAILICEDLWHPSTVMLAAQEGATGLLITSAAPGRGISSGTAEPHSHRMWRDLLQMSCALYGCWAAWSNRTGFEDGLWFSGGSMVFVPYDPDPLVCGDPLDAGLWIGEVDTDRIARSRAASAVRNQEDAWLTYRELGRRLEGTVPLESGEND